MIQLFEWWEWKWGLGFEQCRKNNGFRWLFLSDTDALQRENSKMMDSEHVRCNSKRRLHFASPVTEIEVQSFESLLGFQKQHIPCLVLLYWPIYQETQKLWGLSGIWIGKDFTAGPGYNSSSHWPGSQYLEGSMEMEILVVRRYKYSVYNKVQWENHNVVPWGLSWVHASCTRKLYTFQEMALGCHRALIEREGCL